MFSVAICDDRPEVCRALYRMVMRFQVIPLEAVCYYSSKKLYHALKSGREFDLYILDVALRGMTGLELAERLRGEFDKPDTPILFISEKREFAMELYRVFPLCFLLKPLQEAQVAACLERAARFFYPPGPAFEFKVRKVLNRVPYGDIRWFESRNKEVILHMRHAERSANMRLDEVMDSQPPPPDNFIRIHQSYIANYYYVRFLRCDRLILDNGVELPISYSYRKSVKKKILALEMPQRPETRIPQVPHIP